MILNKADLAGPEQVKKVRAWIDDHFSRLRIAETSYCDVPLESCFRSGVSIPLGRTLIYEHQNMPVAPTPPATTNITATITRRPSAHGVTRPTGRCHWKDCGRLPASCQATSIEPRESPTLRTHQTGGPAQVVGKRVDITLENEWGDRTPRTQIVVIGARGTVDGQGLREKFARCAAPIMR